MIHIYIAGATGYLGRYVLKSAKEHGLIVHAIARDPGKLDDMSHYIDHTHRLDLKKTKDIESIFTQPGFVFSSLGITRQKDGLTYMDVDYQLNLNLLKAAENSGMLKFMYISALNGPLLRDLKIFQAKEAFADALMASSILEPYVIRPNGFFVDMKEIFNMAVQGRAYLFGDGSLKCNPIHGSDLAEFIIETFDKTPGSYNIGGPEVFTQDALVALAFDALGKKNKTMHIPIGLARFIRSALRHLTPETFYGPIEFFLTVFTIDMIAPTYGTHSLRDFYQELALDTARDKKKASHTHK